jgi:hypothetical protein
MVGQGRFCGLELAASPMTVPSGTLRIANVHVNSEFASLAILTKEGVSHSSNRFGSKL